MQYYVQRVVIVRVEVQILKGVDVVADGSEAGSDDNVEEEEGIWVVRLAVTVCRWNLDLVL